MYDWRRLELSDPPESGWKRFLRVRRSIGAPSELTAYIACARAGTTLLELVRVAGMRWTVEESAVGPGRRAERRDDPALVFLAPWASGLGT